MTTTTAPTRASQHLAPQPTSTLTVFLRVARSEWTKLWSLRSTAWTLLALFVITVGFSALASWGTTANLAAAQAGGALDPTSIALAGLLFGQLAIAVLGVLTISGEYSTGNIKTSLTAVPQRALFLCAKAAVFTVVGFVVGLITCFTAFYVGMLFFDAKHIGVGLGDPNVLRAVIGGGMYIAGCGLLGYAIGLILRHSAGAITVCVALLFVFPIVLSAIPAQIVKSINKFVSAGSHITDVLPARGDYFSPWTGFLVFVVEFLVLLAIGGFLMKRRDA